VWLVDLDQLIAQANSLTILPLSNAERVQFFLATIEPTIALLPTLTPSPAVTPVPAGATASGP
jgi:hypothetical protein